MNESPKNNRFKKGFKFGLILSLIFQLITLVDFIALTTAELETRSFAHRFWDFGFPFSMLTGMYGIFSGHANFYSFILNVFFTVVFSFSLGLVFKSTNDLRSFVKGEYFIFGFIAGVVLLHFFNFLSSIQSNLCFDCMVFFGFPYKFAGYGGYVSQTEFYWYPFSQNIIIWLIVCFYSGFLPQLLFTKLAIKRLK